MKDSIDFATMNVTTLFRKLLVPTLLGMIFSAVFIITDGIFVGKGIGSDALAAVNITAPLFLINTGVALMFGIGASVVASIHLSQGKVKVARINITQAVVVSSLLLLGYAGAIMLEVEQKIKEQKQALVMASNKDKKAATLSQAAAAAAGAQSAPEVSVLVEPDDDDFEEFTPAE